jgi:2-C-methyl-D-erythritol 4-phosphate cytidylyltransferase
MTKFSSVILAGGKGKRFSEHLPKQFCSLLEKPIIEYSLKTLSQTPGIEEIVIVCEKEYREHFQLPGSFPYPIKFALPGKERSDSVFNGLKCCDPNIPFIIVHDAARPFIEREFLEDAMQKALVNGACAVGVPLKFTVKSLKENHTVEKTLNREKIWEIQTPQVLKKSLMFEGFSHIQKHQISITDDVSLAEVLGYTVKLQLGSYQNIKITTQEDLLFAEMILNQKKHLLKSS